MVQLVEAFVLTLLQVAHEVMGALWALMKPTNLPLAARVSSILGKMGGRNRRYLKASVRPGPGPVPALFLAPCLY